MSQCISNLVRGDAIEDEEKSYSHWLVSNLFRDGTEGSVSGTELSKKQFLHDLISLTPESDAAVLAVYMQRHVLGKKHLASLGGLAGISWF